MSQYYEVTWVIDVEADSAEDAARQALAIQRDTNSTATYFTVEDNLNVTTHIDLSGDAS